VLTFNISGANTLTIQCSDIEGIAPPKAHNPNLYITKRFVALVVGL